MARSFLGLLFDSKPADSYILIWTKQDAVKLSKYFQSVATATKHAEKVGSKANAYFGIGLASEPTEADQRIKADKIAGVPGLWIDIDYLHGVHKKKHLPANEHEALWLVDQMPLEPSILVHSGHGFQAYWLFPKVVETSTGEARIYLSDLNQRWQYHCRAIARSKNWDVDSTFDLSRVFRIPNTLNVNDPKHPIKVELRNVTDKRYDPDQLEKALEKESVTVGAPTGAFADQASKKRQLAADAQFTIDANAEPPKAKFQALYENDPRFRQSWDKTRTDLSDDSASSYDCSVGTIAFNVGWNDQELVNLIIARRRKHGDDLKLDRNPYGDYYRRTLAAIKTPGERTKQTRTVHRASNKDDATTGATRQKKTAKEVKEESEPAPDEPSDNRETNLQVVSEAFEIEITRIVKYLSDPPQYVIYLGGGKEIEVKPNVFMSQQTMRTTMAIAVNRKIPKMKPARWEHLSDCMFAAMDEVEPGEDTTFLGAIAHYLYKYLHTHYKPELVEESQHDRAWRGLPVKLAGDCCIDIDSYLRFVQTEFQTKLEKSTVTQRLMRLGCLYEKKSLRKGKDVTSRKFWVVPDKFIKDRQLLLNVEAEVMREEEREEHLTVN